ncbi:S-layer homology domain-containing protein [Alkalinema sp. FACHB-956]|uniref:S-layer homology domain-containing protein n=1 Tax=Alkalinema sp. FACHB-956 TaxID=2692768 RepID=UPI00168A200B|nr:S-layer homology domain-containing protein [Alkalinema sp. FACHB-956]MBD2328559.1 S-layer homology domain-containing protein [Alkalinema sp. FACHB-956]
MQSVLSIQMAMILVSLTGLMACTGRKPMSQVPSVPVSSSAEIPASTGESPNSPSNPLPAPTASASPQNSPTPIRFSDIDNHPAAPSILDLAQLNVFEPASSGQFQPDQPITRGEFVRWLVRSHNAIVQTNPATHPQTIQLARTATATFPDVAATHTNFPYIQGLVDAGFVAGYTDSQFKPDDPLTREQMVAIKVGFDKPASLLDRLKLVEKHKNTAQKDFWVMEPIAKRWGWTDYQQVSEKYAAAIVVESQNPAKCLERTYGKTRLFKPQTVVSRGEAAICLAVTSVKGRPLSAAIAVQNLGSQPPQRRN